MQVKLYDIYIARKVMDQLRAQKLPINHIIKFREFLADYNTYFDEIEKERVSLVQQQLTTANIDSIVPGSEQEKTFYDSFNIYLQNVVRIEKGLPKEVLVGELSEREYDLLAVFIEDV